MKKNKFNLDDCINVIDSEISWCKGNEDKGKYLNGTYQMGFVNGLKQARNLVEILKDGELPVIKSLDLGDNI